MDTGAFTQEAQANEKVLRKKMRVKKKRLNVLSRGTLLPWLNVKRRKCIEFRRRQYLEKQGADSDKRENQEEAYHQYHRACGHINMKNLIRFKLIGSVRSPNLPSKYTKNLKKTCPLCVAMKQWNANRPAPVNPEIKQQLKPWERVHTDSTGKRKLASSKVYKYFTVFV